MSLKNFANCKKNTVHKRRFAELNIISSLYSALSEKLKQNQSHVLGLAAKRVDQN